MELINTTFHELDDRELKQLSLLGVTKMTAENYLFSLQEHIKFVREAGHKIGVHTTLLDIHDQSKFSFYEFPYYAKHFHGGGDPDGFAKAWLHHIHHNPHHWQHWIYPQAFVPKNAKNVEPGGVVEMPRPYALEMVADWMGASMAYTGSWDMTKWLWENMPKITAHSETAAYLRDVLDAMSYADVVYMQKFAHES